MISKILIASIRARLTEVTAPGRQREQPFLKLAQIHTLNIQSLFKKNKMDVPCLLLPTSREVFQKPRGSFSLAAGPLHVTRRHHYLLMGSHLLLWGKTGFILPPLSVKEKNSCRDTPSGHYSLFCSTEGAAWRHRPPVFASPYCWAPGGAGCAAACRQVPSRERPPWLLQQAAPSTWYGLG